MTQISIYDETRSTLDAVSPSFCLAKWQMVTLHLGIGENHSCYHPHIHKIDREEIRSNPGAIHNTSFKKKMRKLMLEGQRPSECQYCWNIEDLGPQHYSDRVRHSTPLMQAGYTPIIAALPWDADVYPNNVEVSFSNICNFRCSYCSPGASSRWQNEIEKLGSYPVRDKTVQREHIHPHFAEDQNPYIDAFWKWLPDAYPHMTTLRLTGGEPLMTNGFYRLADYISEHSNPALQFMVNTNMGVPTKMIDKMIETANRIQRQGHVQSFRLHTSIDSWGKQAEYIRDGLEIDLFQAHIVSALQRIDNVELSFMVTFGALSVFNFSEFLSRIKWLRAKFPRNRIDFDIAILTNPTQFDVRILPAEFRPFFDKISQSYDGLGYSAEEKAKWSNVLTYWEQGLEQDRDADRRDFFKFFATHDLRRNTSLLSVFPMLTQFSHQYT